MNRRGIRIAGASVLLAAVITSVPLLHHGEPLHRGRTLGSYLQDFEQTGFPTPQRVVDAEEALRAIGADALPFLVRDLQRADRNPTTRSICKWLAQADRVSPMRRHWYGWVNAPARRRITAERAFCLLGPVCPAEVVRLLEHPNPKVREVAAASLALEHAFGPDGPYMTPALEQLWRAYRDGVGLMRATALVGLSRAALHVPNFESLCVAAATDPDHRVRVSAMRAFAGIHETPSA